MSKSKYKYAPMLSKVNLDLLGDRLVEDTGLPASIANLIVNHLQSKVDDGVLVSKNLGAAIRGMVNDYDVVCGTIITELYKSLPKSKRLAYGITDSVASLAESRDVTSVNEVQGILFRIIGDSLINLEVKQLGTANSMIDGLILQHNAGTYQYTKNTVKASDKYDFAVIVNGNINDVYAAVGSWSINRFGVELPYAKARKGVPEALTVLRDGDSLVILAGNNRVYKAETSEANLEGVVFAPLKSFTNNNYGLQLNPQFDSKDYYKAIDEQERVVVKSAGGKTALGIYTLVGSRGNGGRWLTGLTMPDRKARAVLDKRGENLGATKALEASVSKVGKQIVLQLNYKLAVKEMSRKVPAIREASVATQALVYHLVKGTLGPTFDFSKFNQVSDYSAWDLVPALYPAVNQLIAVDGSISDIKSEGLRDFITRGVLASPEYQDLVQAANNVTSEVVSGALIPKVSAIDPSVTALASGVDYQKAQSRSEDLARDVFGSFFAALKEGLERRLATTNRSKHTK